MTQTDALGRRQGRPIFEKWRQSALCTARMLIDRIFNCEGHTTTTQQGVGNLGRTRRDRVVSTTGGARPQRALLRTLLQALLQPGAASVSPGGSASLGMLLGGRWPVPPAAGATRMNPRWPPKIVKSQKSRQLICTPFDALIPARCDTPHFLR